DYTNDVVYGDLCERKALSKRDRSLITVAALVATYRPEQLVSHLSRAIANGVTQEEITEVITHMAFYAGWPAAMSAAQVAYTVLVEGKKGERTMAGEILVGLFGLGTIGGKMYTNILNAGYKVVVHDLHRQPARHHLQAGAEWADTPRQLAEKSDVIFTSLPEPADVERVALGADGLIEGVKKGAAYFDLSTNAQAVVKKIHEAFAAKGAHMLDAPVSGGPSGAESRKMAIWVGGDKAAYDKHKAVLDAMGDRAAYIGPIGTATVAKLVHNMSGYAITCALAETFTMGVKAG